MAETDALAVGLVAGDGTGKAGEQHTQEEANGGVAGKVDWKKDVPDDIRPTIDKYGSPSDLAKGYSELMKKLGATVQVPGPNATVEERKAFYAKLGRPESPDGYELSTITMPEGIERSKDADKEFTAKMHELNLTKEQTKGLHEWSMKRFTEGVIAQRAAEKRLAEERDAALRKAWGVAHDANQAQVERVIKLGGDAFVAKLNSGPGKDPEIRAGLYEISKLFSEETLVAGRVAERQKTTVRPGMVVDFGKSPELAT